MTSAKGEDKESASDKRTAFERLTDFARRIVTVPKTEIDQQARIYNRKRKRKQAQS